MKRGLCLFLYVRVNFFVEKYPKISDNSYIYVLFQAVKK